MGKKKFDLGSLDTRAKADGGSTCEIKHPTEGTKLDIKIVLAGADSDIYQRHVNTAANRRAKSFRPGQRFVPPTAEETAEAALDLLAACTLSWEGVFVDGQEIPCTKENAVMIYRRFPWIKEQVDDFVADRANFLA